jgi:hypothetical protein
MMPTIITVAVARLAGGFQLADFTTELRDVIGHFAGADCRCQPCVPVCGTP